MSDVIYATTPSELQLFINQLHDTARIVNDRFTACINTPWGVRTLAGKVPAKGQGHRDSVCEIANKHIKLKP